MQLPDLLREIEMIVQRYEKHHALFETLMISARDSFSDEEVNEISDFLEANELGLALQTFIDIAMEELKAISREAASACMELAELMGGSSEFYGLLEIESQSSD